MAGASKFTDEQNLMIKNMLKTGFTYSTIQKELSKKGIKISIGSLSDKRRHMTEYKEEAQKKLFENRKRVVELIDSGTPPLGVAKTFGVTESDVVEFLSKRKRLSDDEKREIIYLYSQGKSMEDLAKKYGVHEIAIKSVVLPPKEVISRRQDSQEETKQEIDLTVAKNFIKFINQLMTNKKIYSEDAEKLNNQRLDILHELEMKELTQEDKLNMLDKIQELSRARRELKDYNQIFEPVIEFLADENNMNTIKTFANKVAEAVNILKEAKTRVYFMRETVEND